MQGQEAVANVPGNVKQAGHTIVNVERLADDKLRLLMKRA